jgi:hypothetical protein
MRTYLPIFVGLEIRISSVVRGLKLRSIVFIRRAREVLIVRVTLRQRAALQRASSRAPIGARTTTRVNEVRESVYEPAVRTYGKGFRRSGPAGGADDGDDSFWNGVPAGVGPDAGVGVGIS